MQNNGPRDSRATTIDRLVALVNEALTVSLIAQLYARGEKPVAPAPGTPEFKKLVVPDGGSGYLEFQWISESFIEINSYLSQLQLDLKSFWIMVEARQDTRTVYESHLEDANKPLNDGISGVRTNLKSLFSRYPGNKIGVDSLAALKRIQDAADTIEATLDKLLKLSPPAKPPIKSKIPRKLVISIFLFTVLTLPIFYWLKLGGTRVDSGAISSHVSHDVAAVKVAAEKAPSSLPSVIFKNIIPVTSNVLLLVSVLLGLIRAFLSDARGDTKKMSEALSTAAKALRDISG